MRKKKRTVYKQAAYRCHRDKIPTPEEHFAEVRQALYGMLELADRQPPEYTYMVVQEHIRVACMMDDYARSIGADPKYWKELEQGLLRGVKQ